MAELRFHSAAVSREWDHVRHSDVNAAGTLLVRLARVVTLGRAEAEADRGRDWIYVYDCRSLCTYYALIGDGEPDPYPNVVVLAFGDIREESASTIRSRAVKRFELES